MGGSGAYSTPPQDQPRHADYNLLYIEGTQNPVSIFDGASVRVQLSAALVDVTQAADLISTASNNVMEVSNAVFGDQTVFIGAEVTRTASQKGKAQTNDNSVALDRVEAGTVQVFGNQILAYGEALRNKITITNSTFENLTIFGGYTTTGGDFSDTEIHLSHSKLGDDSTIMASYLYGYDDASASTGNLVSIGEGVTNLEGNGPAQFNMIVGSYAGPLAANYFLGNTLETASRIVTGTLRNFQNYTFSVSGDTSTKDPIIDVTGTTAVTIEPAEGAPVEAGTYTEELFNYDEEVRTIESLSRVETFRIKPESVDLKIVDSSDPDSSAQDLVTTFESGSSIEVTESANDETNALMQSSASTYGTLWEASDLLVDTALRAPKPVDGLFTAARSGKYGFDRHPRMDSTNTTGLLGYAMTFGKTQTDVFLEMGHADYETDSPTSTCRVTGDGDHNYAGAGVFVSQELIPDLHATAYVKGGVLRNAFDVTIAGKKLDLNRTSAY